MSSKNQAGFTLAELLVTLVIIGVLSVALTGFIATWLQDSAIAQARSALLDTAESALDTVNKDIMLSGSADKNNRYLDPYAPGAPTNQLSWQSSSSVLILARAALDSERNIIFSDPSRYITEKDNKIFYVTNGTLYERTLASANSSDAAITTCPPAQATTECPADKKVATGVSSFLVKYYDTDGTEVEPDNARSVQLAITLQQLVGGKTLSADYTSRMVFRNE